MYTDGLTALQLKRSGLTMLANDLLLYTQSYVYSLEDYLHVQEDDNILAQWLADYKQSISESVIKANFHKYDKSSI